MSLRAGGYPTNIQMYFQLFLSFAYWEISPIFKPHRIVPVSCFKSHTLHILDRGLRGDLPCPVLGVQVPEDTIVEVIPWLKNQSGNLFMKSSSELTSVSSSSSSLSTESSSAVFRTIVLEKDLFAVN